MHETRPLLPSRTTSQSGVGGGGARNFSSTVSLAETVMLSCRRKIEFSPLVRLIVVLPVIFSFLTLPVYAEYYPERPTYDYHKSGLASLDCQDLSNPASDHGRCGPTDGPVFNSFINTPSYGDERSFFDARRSDQTSTGSFRNLLPDATEGSQLLVLRIYINNNANEGFGYKTTAQDTRVRVALPTATAPALRAIAYISASNASPNTVEDTVDLTSTEPFRIQYVPGSAELFTGTDSRGPLPDEIVTRGALVTNMDTDGLFAAGFDRDAVVQLRLQVNPIEARQRWVFPLVAGLAVFGSLSWPKSRQLLMVTVDRCWAWQERERLGPRILAGLVVSVLFAGLTFLIGYLS